jgi:hypothetical protein
LQPLKIAHQIRPGALDALFVQLIFDSLKQVWGAFLSQVAEIVIGDFVPSAKCSAIY